MADRLVVGVSGASGAPIAVELLRALRELGVESHLVITHGGELTVSHETGLTVEQFMALAHTVYNPDDIGAAPSSGSWRSMGMVVVPCSMKTAAGIHSGYSDNLLLRAADVTLKEHRRLVLCPRETPLSSIHLRNLYELSRDGAVILPPVLSYYQKPECIEDMTEHIVGKILDMFSLEYPRFRRWEGN